MLRLTRAFAQKNALWVRVNGGMQAKFTGSEEQYKALFPNATAFENINGNTGKWKGYGKLTFNDEETARGYFQDRMDKKFVGSDGKDYKVIIDLVADQNKLFMNCAKSLSAQAISDANVFDGLTQITEQKGTQNQNHFILTFEDYKKADACFENKLKGEIGQIDGKGFLLIQPGVRRNLGRENRGRNRDQASQNKAASE